jgi:hypothetical protein
MPLRRLWIRPPLRNVHGQLLRAEQTALLRSDGGMVADRCACVPCVLGECTNGPVASQCRYSATFLPVGAVLSRTPQLS